ncbi:muscular LMNA-interacting protein isoform X2 [Pyxicephalus adspersus]|uniref:muscular LMNA-interacting protein isoform X2 n=1 Tax=Pyxicephalus adspersus TaxID=30357 RepID=UPI003B5A3939
MDLGSYKSTTVPNKDLKKLVMASGTNGEERTNQLRFTFVPSTGTLPSQVLVGKDQLPKILIGQKGKMKKKPAECERNLEIKTHEPSESFLDSFRKEKSGEEAASNKLEEIKHNDLFIAEFVVVMDSDDGEDEKFTKKKIEAKDYEFLRAQQSAITQPKEVLSEANVHTSDYPATQQVFRPDMDDLELEHHLYLPTSDVNSYRFQLTNLSHSSKGISKYNRSMFPSEPVILNEKTENINTFSEPLLSQDANYLNVLMPNLHPQHSLTSLSHSQIPRQNIASGKSIRSNAMSPLPIRIIKHPLCRSPSPLGSQLFGSSSSICSVNDFQSPVSRPDSMSRLSFLTSLLKSKKSAYDRTISPDPNPYNTGVKSTSQFYKTTRNSSPPRKSQSCFALYYPKDLNISDVQRKYEKQNLPSPSASDILHSESIFQSKTLRSLSPESIPIKSSSCSFVSRKGVVSPLLELPQQPNTIFHSSRENMLSRNEKPPLNKESYTPLKKYSVLGRSRRVTLFPPPSHFHQSISTSQKQNVMPYIKKYVPVKGNLRPSFSLNENLDRNCARSASPMEITESYMLPPSYPNTYQLFNENVDSGFNVSSLPLSYKHHCESSEELSRNYTPMCTSPTNILGSPRSMLSRSCEQRSASSLSQRSDQENKQAYKIKSSYKSFAAIPTNTLLRDQKAIDKPEITTTSSKENMDPHQEMCSPALLRQQTEEICAAIDEVLHDDPLPVHHKATLKSAMKKKDSKTSSVSIQILKSPPKSAGRETKYASIQHLANTRTNNLQTRPGVIRPISLKIDTTESMDGHVSPFDLPQFSIPQYRRETYFVESRRKDVPSGV